MNPKFKDKKVDSLVIDYGDCYTIKRKYESQLSSPFQKVVFAALIDGEIINELRDISPDMTFESVSGKKVKIKKGSVVTTTADIYDDDDDFLLLYEETSERISEFMSEYQSENKNKKSQSNKKAISRPRSKH